MWPASVGFRRDRNRVDSHAPRGADDAAGNLAAVGDEEERNIAPLSAWRGLLSIATEALLLAGNR